MQQQINLSLLTIYYVEFPGHHKPEDYSIKKRRYLRVLLRSMTGEITVYEIKSTRFMSYNIFSLLQNLVTISGIYPEAILFLGPLRGYKIRQL